jgi:hypothetical protein
MNVPPSDVHWPCWITAHPPLDVQHAPVGCGHVTVAHVVPAPRNVPPAEPHAALVPTEQLPFTAQHAPLGCGHGFGEQTVPSPWYVAVHDARVTAVHAPLAAQHAPVAGWAHTDVTYVICCSTSRDGRHEDDSALNRVYPAGHPPAQLIASSQFRVGYVGVAGLLDCAHGVMVVPSVARNALLQKLTVEHAVAPGWLCRAIFTTTDTFPVPLSPLTIIRSPGSAVWSTENCTFATDAGIGCPSAWRTSRSLLVVHAVEAPCTRARLMSGGSSGFACGSPDVTVNARLEPACPGSPSHTSIVYPIAMFDPIPVAGVPATNSTSCTSTGNASFSGVAGFGSATLYVLANPSPSTIPSCSVISPPWSIEL